MSMVDSRNFHLPQQHVSRKPLPQPGAAPAARPPPNVQPDQAYLPQHAAPAQQQPQRQQQQHYPSQNPQLPVQPDEQYTHTRSRTASSSIFPLMTSHQPPAQQMPQHSTQGQYQSRVNQYAPPASRRTLSDATTDSNSSNSNDNTAMPTRQNSSASSDLQRSTSATSSNSPSSYVAMMRKQKATVWSDRTQHEDPRMVAAQRLAKQRALREVTGAAMGSRVSTSGSSSITGGVRSKIRHHGAPKAQQYAPGALPASGVPVRLSQNEIDEDDDDDENQAAHPPVHRRTDSGRSSLGSAGRVANLYSMQGAGDASQYGVSTGSTPPLGSLKKQSPGGYKPVEPSSADETPVPGRFEGGDYFAQKQAPETRLEREDSKGSGSSTDREDSFGVPGKLPQRVKPVEETTLDAAELRRRGSVDERTMTMSGYGKLFVANPDVDD